MPSSSNDHRHKTTARTVFVFHNGMIATCDADGQQISELQGRDTPELRMKIAARSDEHTEWNVTSIDQPRTTPRYIRQFRWMVVDALTRAASTAARAQEATEGSDATLLLDEVRAAILDFRDSHPAMRKLTTAALKDMS